METDAAANDQRVNSPQGVCADDVSVLDLIETCYGKRPVLLSKRLVDRRLQTSGKYSDCVFY